jgi:TRAP-type C4-dicarboxylate transport system permease small subunit
MSIRTLNRALAKILDWVIGFIMIAIVIIIFAGVILRYVFDAPLFWSEEVTVLGLIWMTFLGGAILVRDNKNVCITVICDMCRPYHSRYMRMVADDLVLIILVVMIWQSWKLAGRLAISTTPALRISEAWFGYALVVGFVLMFFYQIQRSIALLRNKPAFSEKDDDGPEGKCNL